jgi:hypothetical protein
VERFRASEAHAAFSKRWNLPAYFSLQFQDVAGAFEAAARAPKLEPAPAPAPGAPPRPQQLQLAVSVALWDGAARCGSERVFLAPLGDKFLRLACQLVARYAAWVCAAAAARRAAAANPQPPAPPPPPAAAPAVGQPGSPLGSGAAGGAAGGAAAPTPAPQAHGPEAWAGAVSGEELLGVVCDADAVAGLVPAMLRERFGALLPGLAGGAAEQLAAALGRAGERVSEAANEVGQPGGRRRRF